MKFYVIQFRTKFDAKYNKKWHIDRIFYNKKEATKILNIVKYDKQAEFRIIKCEGTII